MLDWGNAQSMRIEVDADGIAMLTIDVPGQAANTMSAGFKAELRDLVPRLRGARDRLSGVVITSAKKTFFAGGDLRSLIAVQPGDAQNFYDGLEDFKRALRGLEQLGLPVAVAINGAALGGGWEICLCTHARFCLADEKLLLGLPEASLGLLPGAGGVSRMVRLLGLRRALPLLVGGKTFSPGQALSWGLLQGTGPDMPSVIAAARQWVLDHPQPVVPWDAPGFAIADLDADLAHLEENGAAELYADGHGLYPARSAVFANAVEGAMVDIDAALRLETRYLTSLATGQVAKNMINTFFFQSNQLKSGKGRPSEGERVPEKRLRIEGHSPAALHAALAGALRRVPCTLHVRSAAAPAEAKAALEATVHALVAQGRLLATRADGVRASIDVCPKQEGGESDGLWLVEESEGASPDAVVLLPGDPRAEATVDVGRIGLRAMPELLGAGVVEVVRGPQSDAAMATRVYDFLQQIGKTPIVVSNDPRGFLQRLGRAAGEEGLALCREGLSPAFVDTVTRQTDMAQGAMALAARFCGPGPVEADARASDEGLARVREAQDRVLFIQALQALRCLEEGVVASAMDANFASLQGVGFPSWTGGAIQYVNQYGLAKFAERAQLLAAMHGERFEPPRLLRDLVNAGARTVER
ncbi:enoyl-CoA hydratase-related protein [uncultured Hydrogenophaga sp.]|uniref:enoyl-CoA hydratase-related protein n=1 Tax=uncultured Hydrogenophaga sp. TaxID=199683 RepID=UPI0025853026|nr:enoyl-CoA hydratase-related protein [uncultured Hydrogenophaga sp.]